MDIIVESFMTIPPIAVVLLGVGATLKYAYQVIYKGELKNSGALLTMLYLTGVYILIAFPNHYHAAGLVRIGICALFVDKIIVFCYDLLFRKWYKPFSPTCFKIGGIKHGK